MELSHALRLQNLPRLALVGAGGKSTALFQLAHECSPALVTASTHLGTWQTCLADQHFIIEDTEQLSDIEAHFDSGVTLITGPIPAGSNRTLGLSTDQLKIIHTLADCHNLPLFIEADGAHQRPLKAPDKHEPTIPDFVDTVVVVAGLSALGKPLSDKFVHRPEIFAKLSGLAIGDAITLEAIACILIHPEGGQKNISSNARRVVLLNQADTLELQSHTKALSERLLPTFHTVVVTSLDRSMVVAVHEPVAAIILAAGASTRYGQPKQLLELNRQSFVQTVVKTALAAGLSPVIMVTGAYTKKIEMAVKHLPVQIVHNADWQHGQSSSIRAGLVAIPKETGAAIFLLADKPQVSWTLLSALVEEHANHLHPVIAPLVEGHRTNPVLFDRNTFPDLMELKGDVGGRALFSKYRVEYLPWHDSRLLLDIDTPDDYHHLKEMFL